MKITRILFGLLLFTLIAPLESRAHFLWITAGSQTKDGKVHVWFSDTAGPDDPDLLNKVASLQLWQLPRDGKPVQLKTSKGEDSLVADPANSEGSVFIVSYDYGLFSRGQETFRLKYHAKCQPTQMPESWRAISNAEQLPLEIVARSIGDQTVLTVLWQGKPAAGSTVTVNGPGIESKLENNTSDKGEVSFSLKNAGLYSIRAKYSEATPGELDGKAYSAVRHYATLALSIDGDRPAAVAPVSVSTSSPFPALDPGITSFGAAIAGDNLYLYGGHFGKPHHYSTAGQSDQLLRLNIRQPGKWEFVAKGPKRTGLAAVAYNGKFYRIGGFEARNGDDEKQSLWSMPDFAVFDPRTNEWTQLPSMPAGRSSHDALVIGSTLYVIGGWELKGEDQSNWHETAYRYDLAASQPEWQELLKPPFKRRALSLGEWQGKVYVIGGMQPEGGPTTATAFYDPQTKTWSEGPKLNGEPMEGFGSSSFLLGKRLCVSTFAGNLQILSDDGSQWINGGKLTYPRFFHRMIPLSETEALIVGGASMKDGKIRELETVSVASGPSSD